MPMMTYPRFLSVAARCLDNTLSHHSLGNLDEACHVSTLHVVDVTVGLSSVLHAVLVNVVHDALQIVVNFLSCPAQTLRVLTHLKTRYRYTTGVAGLTRRVENLGILEDLDSFGQGRHVGTLGYGNHAIVNQSLSLLGVDFVLSSARKCDVGLLVPGVRQPHILRLDIPQHIP